MCARRLKRLTSYAASLQSLREDKEVSVSQERLFRELPGFVENRTRRRDDSTNRADLVKTYGNSSNL